MQAYIIDMVAKDVTAQWLMGDKLKNDQLCFLYEVVKIIYQSPLRIKLINMDKEVIENVIPQLACFRALLVIKDIIQIKIDEKKKAKSISTIFNVMMNAKKMKEQETAKQEEEEKGDIEEDKTEESETDMDANEEMKEFRRKKREEEEEIRKYGRQWIWKNYISENRKENWTETAEVLRHINAHVVQDIQDFILIQGFKKLQQKDRKLIEEKVEALFVMNEDSKVREDKAMLEGKLKKRKFEQSLRPPYVWNFNETRLDKEEKMKIQQDRQEVGSKEVEPEDNQENKPYLLNSFAQPEICYKNEESIKENRVKTVLKSVETLSHNLKTHEVEKWKTLIQLCVAIFKELANKENSGEKVKK